VVDANGYIINADPVYWTTYDDAAIWFDGINLAVDTTLQQSKSSCYGVVIPTWTMADNFVPNLPEKMFPTLLADAKGTAFLQLKQQGNMKEETKARRGRARLRNEAWRVDSAETRSNTDVNYGRK